MQSSASGTAVESTPPVVESQLPAPDPAGLHPQEPLPVGHAQLWVLRPDAVDLPPLLRAAERLLTPEERARRDRFALEEPRVAFVLGRGMVRTSLARCTGVAPGQVRLRIGPHGRPELDGESGSPPVRFNLTHTRGLVACALARAARVGVDAEDLDRGLDHGAIARRHFAPAEVEQLRGLSGEPLRRRFFALWTLKESYLKARGEGISLGLSRFAFRLDPIRLELEPGLDDDPSAWQFELLEPSPRHLVAMSVKRGRQPDLEVAVREVRMFSTE